MVSTPQRHRHRKDAPVKEQRVLSAAGDRLTRGLDEINVRAGADSRHRAIRLAYVSCSLREHEVDVKVQQASLKNADIRTTMNTYTQAIPKAVREANRRVVRINRKRGGIEAAIRLQRLRTPPLPICKLTYPFRGQEAVAGITVSSRSKFNGESSRSYGIDEARQSRPPIRFSVFAGLPSRSRGPLPVTFI
jgi:hypothetical protein